MDETLVHCSLDPFVGYQEIVQVTHSAGNSSKISSADSNNYDSEMNDNQTSLQVHLILISFLIVVCCLSPLFENFLRKSFLAFRGGCFHSQRCKLKNNE